MYDAHVIDLLNKYREKTIVTINVIECKRISYYDDVS
jgi:hypothetical protein